MSKRDYYEVLGVSQDAEKGAIKKAYRKLAMEHHPDKNPDDQGAEEKFREAAEAYEILSDDQKRQRYNQYGHAGVSGQSQGFSSHEDIFSSFGDIFGDFFGGGSSSHRSTGPRKGADLRYRTEISLSEVLEGVEQNIEFETDGECQKCDGSGAKRGTKPETCSTCGGSGQVVRAQGFFSMASTCSSCHGKGKKIKQPCRSCHGQGREKLPKKIKVNIPKGVSTGTRLRVNGEGEGGLHGGPDGDLYVEIIVQEDRRFEREGEHLLTTVSISYLQAILGGSVEVENVQGVETLKIPRGTQPGQTLKILKAGLPTLQGKSQGNLFCQIEVKIPHRISKEEEELLKKLAEKNTTEPPPSKSSKTGGIFNKFV